MISKQEFAKLKEEHKGEIVAALMHAKYPGASAEANIFVDVPAGYNVRFACVLKFEEPEQIVKKIFVMLEEFNKSLSGTDIDTIADYVGQLAKTKEFDLNRDDLWVVTSAEMPFKEYEIEEGKVKLMGLETFLRGIEKFYDTDRELRDVLRHYGFTK